MAKPKILVTVKDGIVISVMTDRDMDIVIADMDVVERDLSPVSSIYAPDFITKEPFYMHKRFRSKKSGSDRIKAIKEALKKIPF